MFCAPNECDCDSKKMVFPTQIDDYPKNICNTNQNVIKMGVIIDVVYCNIYQCFLVAQGKPKKKGAATGKKIEIYISSGSSTSSTYRQFQNKFYFTA
jgi:hypothetical protein